MTARSVEHGSRKVARDLHSTVSSELARLGLFCRVFYRVKDAQAAQKKKERKSYGTQRRLQDAIGMRIALYFADDIDVTIDAVKRIFAGRYVDCTRDVPRPDSFCPS